MKNLAELCNSKIGHFYDKNSKVYCVEDFALKVIRDFIKSERYEAVVKSGRKAGIVTLSDMLRVSQPDATRLKDVWRVTGYITKDEKILDAVRMMNQIGVRAVPVMEEDEVLGCFTQVNLCEAICRVEELPDIKARELMKTPVTSLDINERISVARSLMLQEGISNIPIIEYGGLVGMITAGIIINHFLMYIEEALMGGAAWERGGQLSGIVGRVMDQHPFTADVNAHWRSIACGLSERKKGACTIIDGDRKVIGIVTPREIMRPLLTLTAEEETPIYMIGFETQELLEKKLAEESIRRILKRTQRLHPHVEEVRINIKRTKALGIKTRYEIIAQTISAGETYIAEAKGRDILNTFKILCEKLEKELKKGKDLKTIDRND
ncbi:CBS domain-containing protein [Candidatus Bathyarchaeota archaeon]|nr:CBS domain-containing protein [Candidatus Bathyarchaeota archaeon]MBS7630459.1 CBS domain-containing protein [Candidatus Bathyarchaeota archaeon]